MTNTKFSLILMAFVTLILMGILGFGLWQIKTKNNQASELLHEAEHLAEVDVLTQFIQTVQAEAGQSLRTFDSLTLSSAKLVSFIESIEGVGKELGLEVKIVSVDRVEVKDSPEPPTFKIAIDTSGSWQGNFSYLAAIESLPTRVMVESINLSKAEEKGWQSRIVVLVHSFD